MTDDNIKIELLSDSRLSANDNLINFKIIIVGESGVGKSSILKRAVQNKFDESYQATIGFEFLLMHFKVNDLRIKLQIWDTCGQEMYRSLIQGFYRNTTATILVFSKTNRSSFDNLGMWIKDIKNNTEQDMPILLAGNKNDEEKDKIEVNKEEAEEISKQYNLRYFCECSAKTGYNINNIFEEIAKVVYKDYYLKRNPRKQMAKMGLEKREENIGSKKRCC